MVTAGAPAPMTGVGGQVCPVYCPLGKGWLESAVRVRPNPGVLSQDFDARVKVQSTSFKEPHIFCISADAYHEIENRDKS